MQQDFERYADEIKDGLKEDGPEFEPFVPFESEERTPLPSFPVDALPSELRNYVSAVAESLQVPVDMPAVVGLSVIALCVQGSFVINPIQGWFEPLGLYTATVALPSERKSPVMAAMTFPV